MRRLLHAHRRGHADRLRLHARLFPLSQHRFHLLPEPLAFTTGTRPELLFVDPLLTVALVVLAGWVADPAFVTAQWHQLIHRP